jgi:hypothetical protein
VNLEQLGKGEEEEEKEEKKGTPKFTVRKKWCSVRSN